VACAAPGAEVTVDLTLQLVGYRPIKITGAQLSGGRSLDLRELVFKRD
jgi:hypothetical protein